MSKPDPKYIGVGGLSCEVMSAMSALAMYPSPIPEPDGEFLVDRDEGAKHCREHLSEGVLEQLNELSRRISDARGAASEDGVDMHHALAYVAGITDTVQPPTYTRRFTDAQGFVWVYDCGWRIEGSHPYRLYEWPDMLSQPIGIISFFRETGVKPSPR